MQARAGLRRTIGTAGVYDGWAADMDVTAGRWQTVCEKHGAVCSHHTLKHAMNWARFPHLWCEECGKEQRRAIARQEG